MQTVHLWSPNHLLLADHPVAKRYRNKVDELLVVVHHGKVVEVHPPPMDTSCFRELPWIVTALKDAYQRGVSGREDMWIKPPEGWILWPQIKPGMLAFDGGERYILYFPTPFWYKTRRSPTPLIRSEEQSVEVNAVELETEHRTETCYRICTDADHEEGQLGHLYLKVLAEGLTQEQCLEIRTNCREGLTVENALKQMKG